MSIEEAYRYIEEGQFAQGSMLPKGNSGSKFCLNQEKEDKQ